MSNNIIRVHRPVLTDEERARRMEQIKKAAEHLLIAVELSRKENKA